MHNAEAHAMTLRCQPGDVCIVVGGYRRFIGHIVTVTGACPVHAGCWDTDPPKYFGTNPLPISFEDYTLRPIRPDAEADETVTQIIEELTAC